jgi:amidase
MNKNALSPQVSRREVLAMIGAASTISLTGCGEDSPPAPVTREVAYFDSLLSIAARIEAGDISPVFLTEAMLGRIEELEPQLQAYATVMSATALAAAEQAETEVAAGRYRGPLHGIPVAVKDLCYTKAVPTMGGMGVYRDFVPEYDATVVRRLKEAGAVLIGKLNLTEGAMGGYHPDFEVPKNPWAPDHWVGASSSGSGVATAAGMCFGSLGSDTGGSIRFPSQANGIVGLKPTYGRVSRHGVIPLAESMDHVGPMTRRVADAAAMLQVIGGPDPNDPTTLDEPMPDLFASLKAGVKGLRIGYDEAFVTEGIDPLLVSAIKTALDTLADMGAEIVELKMPDGSPGVADPWFVIAATEALQAHRQFFPERAEEFGPYFREFLQLGASFTEEQIADARAFRSDYSVRLNAMLQTVDAVALSAGGMTFPFSEAIQRGGLEGFDPFMPKVAMHHTIPADFAGTPALTLPCGFTEKGIPLGIQFMGQLRSEAMLCRLGYAYEGATEWHERQPEV